MYETVNQLTPAFRIVDVHLLKVMQPFDNNFLCEDEHPDRFPRNGNIHILQICLQFPHTFLEGSVVHAVLNGFENVIDFLLDIFLLTFQQ